MLDGTKSKFEWWTVSMEKAAQIPGQDNLCIVFSKIVGSLLTSAFSLMDWLPHLTWTDLKNELFRQYSPIPFNNNDTQAFAYLLQGSDELHEMYLHSASEHLLKIHHMTDMFKITAEGINHYTVVYGLNINKLKYKAVGHKSATGTQWKSISVISLPLVLAMMDGHQSWFQFLRSTIDQQRQIYKRARTMLQLGWMTFPD